MMFCVFVVQAQTFYVDTNGTNIVSDGTYLNPYTSFKDVMDVVWSDATVVVKSGTHYLSEGIVLWGKENVIFTAENDQTIIDGSQIPENYVYNVNGALVRIVACKHVTISKLKLQNIHANHSLGLIVENSDNMLIEGNEILGIKYAVTTKAINEVGLGIPPHEYDQYGNLFLRTATALQILGSDYTDSTSNIKILNNKLYNNKTGWSETLVIKGNVTNFLIENNEVRNNSNIGIDISGHYNACEQGWQNNCGVPIEEYTHNSQANNGVIKGNLVCNNVSENGIHGAGIYVDGAKKIVVENNTVHNNDFGISVGCEKIGKSASDILVRNNLVYENKNAGIDVGGFNYYNANNGIPLDLDQEAYSGLVTNVAIVNNTIANNSNNIQDFYNGQMLISYLRNSIIKNNIFYAGGHHKRLFSMSYKLTTSHLNFDHNIFYTTDFNNDSSVLISINAKTNGQGEFLDYNDLISFTTATGHNQHAIFSNPYFVNSNTGSLNLDFHVNAISPVVGFGEMIQESYQNPVFGDYTSTGLDLDTRDRVVNNTIDVGAYQMQEQQFTDKAISFFEDLTVFPNPTSEYIYVPSTYDESTYTATNILTGTITNGVVKNGSFFMGNLQNGMYSIVFTDVSGVAKSIKIYKN